MNETITGFKTDTEQAQDNNGRIDIRTLQKQISAVITENEKFYDLKNQYAKFSERLTAISSALELTQRDLKSISKELNPFENYKMSDSRHYSTKTARLESRTARENLFNLMKSGTHITSELIRNTYPDFSQTQIMSMLQQLSKIPNVKKGNLTNSRAIHLFI